MNQVLKRIMPRAVRAPLRTGLNFVHAKTTRSWTARALACDARDAWDWVRGRRDPLVPPRKLVFGIGGDLFVAERFVGHFRDLGGLQPTDAVLDVGCGVGRMALPLTRYLTPPGRYEGFDIVRANVAWCQSALTPRFPHFRFLHADIANREYNPRGAIRGRDFRFPYPDRAFDFAFLTSVFTHLLPGEVAHYLCEIGRVLRPGGRCLATAYLLNPESSAAVDRGAAAFTLAPADGPCRVHSRAVPETCVALDEAWFEQAAAIAGLALDRPVKYGLWCGREAWTDFQDMAILRAAA